jgi:hypothetical protein
MVDRIRLIGHDSGGGAANNYFTHMETRAALIEPLINEDNDTLPDDWEVANNLDPNDDGSVNAANGPDGDPDNDSFTNLQEFEARTDPMDDDSDDDNLLDGDEVAGAGNRPPTDPLNPDTDGDSLNDDVESNSGNFINTNDTGTNPTLTDSDSDGTGDFDEVTAGTDPNDPAAGGNLALGKLGGYFTAAGDPAGSWGGLPATNVNDGLPDTISHPLEMVSADYYEIDLGADTSISSIAITGRGFRDDCCAERLENPTLVVVNSTGDEVFRQEYVGQIIMTETFDLSAAPPFGQFVRVTNSSGASYGPQLGEIEIFGSSTPPAPLTITGFSADPATGDITLTWNSQPGAQYSLFGSEDLVNVEEINDSLNSDGTRTTLSFNFPSIIGKPKYFSTSPETKVLAAVSPETAIISAVPPNLHQCSLLHPGWEHFRVTRPPHLLVLPLRHHEFPNRHAPRHPPDRSVDFRPDQHRPGSPRLCLRRNLVRPASRKSDGWEHCEPIPPARKF